MSENQSCANGSMLLAFLLGGVIGAGIALLVAPQSGKETREKIKDLTGDLREKAADYAGQVKNKVSSTVEHGKEFIDEKKTLISSAIEAGKDAYSKEKEKHSRS